jgi:hypothetical protein
MGESQSIPGKKLDCAVTVRVDSVPKSSVNGQIHGNRVPLVIVSDVFDSIANCKLRHRKLLLESSIGLYLPKRALAS